MNMPLDITIVDNLQKKTKLFYSPTLRYPEIITTTGRSHLFWHITILQSIWLSQRDKHQRKPPSAQYDPPAVPF